VLLPDPKTFDPRRVEVSRSSLMGLGDMRIEPELITDDGRPGTCYDDRTPVASIPAQGLSRRLIVMTKIKFFENESNL
jgi:hypothetical protein